MRLLKLNDKRTGWVSEGAVRRQARKFFKRLEHRHNRKLAKQQCKQGATHEQ